MTTKKLLLAGFIVVLLIAIPLTVYLAQRQQETRSRAAPATVLYFSPLSSTTTRLSTANPLQVNVGQEFSLYVMMDPGNNQVFQTTLEITYDPTKIATASPAPGGDALEVNTNAFPLILAESTGDIVYTPGKILVTLSRNSATLTKYINELTQVAKVTFKALTPTGTTPTQIVFGTKTNAFAGAEDADEKTVLASKIPAAIAVLPEVSPTFSPTPTATSSANQPPVCTSLNIDRIASGSAPFAITFTANGADPDGIINKVTLNFGDGPVKDVTEHGGIGTNRVSTQISHSYQNPGTYAANAIFTDDKNGVSAIGNCTQTITVSQGIGGPLTPTEKLSPTLIAEEPTSTPFEIPKKEFPPITSPGPEGTIIGIGALGALLTIIGGIIFFVL